MIGELIKRPIYNHNVAGSSPGSTIQKNVAAAMQPNATITVTNCF